MNTRTSNMFAVTNEDLPLFSGAVVDIEHATFEPEATPETVNPLPMYDENMRPTVQPLTTLPLDNLETKVDAYMDMNRRQILEIVKAYPAFDNLAADDLEELSFHDLVRAVLYRDHDLPDIDTTILSWYKKERR